MAVFVGALQKRNPGVFEKTSNTEFVHAIWRRGSCS
jgi:hypothetical protein